MARLAREAIRTRGEQAIYELDGVQIVERRERLFRRLLGIADVAATVAALTLAVVVLGGSTMTLLGIAVLPLVVALAKIKGLYDRDELLIRKTTIDESPQLFQLATLLTLVLWLGDTPLAGGTLTQEQVIVFWSVFFGLALLMRRAARAFAKHLSPVERVLFVGDEAAYRRLQAKLEDPSVRADAVHRIPVEKPRFVHARIQPRDAQLREIVRAVDAHRIIIDPQALAPEEMLDLVRAAKAIGVRVSLLPRVLDVVGSSVVFDDLSGLTVMGIRRFGLTRSSRLLKRTFDVAGSTALLLLFAPLMAVIAVAIRLDSGGPVLFRQTRIGRGGRPFRICKYRTMCTDAEELKAELRDRNEVDGGLFKMSEDPRVTRVGRLLRRTSLDELPQLLNVLGGSMSLVGPRPLVVDEDRQIQGWDRRRLQLTPGMTGHWQILGSSRVPLPEMVKIDYVYVASWSLWSDAKILLRTIPYVLSRRGM